MELEGTPVLGQPHSSGKQSSPGTEENLASRIIAPEEPQSVSKIIASEEPLHPNSSQHDSDEQPSSKLIEMVRNLRPLQIQHSIFRVHDELRNVQSKAYDPILVAIGPYHSQDANFKKMETHKLRYLNSFLARENKSIEDCVSIMRDVEIEARACYAEAITGLEPNEFIDMLVLDGCFILEFALRWWYRRLRQRNVDPIFSMPWMKTSVCRDLLLFENQIPLFIIRKLYNLIDGAEKYADLGTMLTSTVSGSLPLQRTDLEISPNTKHLLELIHTRLIRTHEDLAHEEKLKQALTFIGKRKHRKRNQDLLISATGLAKYNVRFQRFYDAQSMFHIGFENGLLRIPCLAIYDDTESLFRNLIAYEQYFLDGNKYYVTDFTAVMDCLINNVEDVKLLAKYGIIENWLGSEEDVVNMFNKLGDGVVIDSGNFTYEWHIENVMEHCSRRKNEWVAKLKKNHLNSPWAIIPIVVASILIILAILQTAFTIKK